MDDLLSEFLTETTESMETLDLELVKLEQNPNDQEILSNIFRLVHTIKGTCGFLGLPRLEAVAHASENVLGQIRDGKLEVSADAISLILASLDQIKMILNELEKNETEPAGDDADLIARLNYLADTGQISQSQTKSSPPVEQTAPPKAEQKPEADTKDAEKTGNSAFDAMLNSDEVQTDSPELQAAFDAAEYKGPGNPNSAREQNANAQDDKGPDDKGPDDKGPDDKGPDNAGKVPAAISKPPAKADRKIVAKKTSASEGKNTKSAGVTQTIRVNVDLLENLMTMVSELVLTRNQLLQILRTAGDTAGDSEFNAPLQRLSHVTSELQEGVMKTRMQPIGNAWSKLPRIIRDLSLELDKKIDLQMIGAETELDRQVLEIIKDPLTHMVRNSGDHGIEIPSARVEAGKPETGTITLNAYHEGGHIHIEISDDGRGLNTEKIREKVLNNGLVTEDQLDRMSPHQIHQFIFAAGLSTAQQVTSVSGRGVGMDVVKTNIDKIGGTVELKSVEGKGSTFLIKIPLTLAIVSALIVECADERFAIPQISVVELVRASNNSEHTIEEIHGTPVLRLRNRLLPLISMRRMLVPDNLTVADMDINLQEENFIVVAQVGNNQFGIIVDKIFDSEEIVVKPTASILRNIEIFSGNTILGDGSVIMILDPNGIAKKVGEVQSGDKALSEEQTLSTLHDEERVALLMFRAGSQTPKAVPLALVARLEEIDFDKVEYTDGQCMVQYRGRLMPLVPITSDYKFPETGRKPTLVFSDRERTMGLVVDEIMDIVEDRLSVEHGAEGKGKIGSAIITGQATEIIDTGYYLTLAFSDWFGGGENENQINGRLKVLLVDDSAFFRNLLTPILSVAGYSVMSVADPTDVVQMIERGDSCDVLISDIEMPQMSGIELCKYIRNSGTAWAEMPIIALTGFTSPEDLERGRQAGFTDYVAKHDRDGLLKSIAEL